MGETKVDFRHLLEDIRDGYPCQIEEAILTELISNSLDSKCTSIQIRVDTAERSLVVVDDGEGMSKEAFERYHDIASSTKRRGKGIGFAGIGAKLALLVCEEVLTETKQGKSHLCSTWRLRDSFHAPWRWIQPMGMVGTPRGTAVLLRWPDRLPYDEPRVRRLITQTFYPLLDDGFNEVMDHVYPKGLQFYVNGVRLARSDCQGLKRQYFLVGVRKRNNVPMGIGFLDWSAADLPEPERGVAISTYGKVIKRGWEWLGVVPKTPKTIAGIVEVPELVACLATHKCDFLPDASSKRKFYQVRKEIQKAVIGLLNDWGQMGGSSPNRDQGAARIEKELDEVLRRVLLEFPELQPLIDPLRLRNDAAGTTPVGPGGTPVEDAGAARSGGGNGGEGGSQHDTPTSPDKQGRDHESSLLDPTRSSRRRRPAGLMITFDDTTGGDELGWLRQGTVAINAAHPAYKRVEKREAEGPFIAFVVALLLSAELWSDTRPMAFVQRFLCEWGRAR